MVLAAVASIISIDAMLKFESLAQFGNAREHGEVAWNKSIQMLRCDWLGGAAADPGGEMWGGDKRGKSGGFICLVESLVCLFEISVCSEVGPDLFSLRVPNRRS